MAWVKLDDQARHHRKLLAAGPVGAWLWTCGLMYCNSQKARDGFIPEAAVPVLYPIPGWRREAARLVSVGLWERVEGGYRIHDYHDYQPTVDAETLSVRRSSAGRLGGQRSGEVRKAKQLASEATKQLACEATNPVPSRPDPVQERSEIPEPVVEAKGPERPRLTTFEEPYWRTAYVDSVRAALQRPWSLPEKQARSIRSAVEGHCDALADIDGWLRHRVPAFVCATRERAAYYAGLGPDGFLKWLNEESARSPAAVAAAPPAPPEQYYPPPTPEEAAELEQALRDMVSPPEAKSGVRAALVGEDMAPEDLERLEAKRRETVAKLRAETAAAAAVPR